MIGNENAIINPVSIALAAYPAIITSGQSGNITLTGTVEDGSIIPAIIATATAVAGVTNVTNQIEIADISAKDIKMKVCTDHSNLNMREEPTFDAEIVAKAAQDEIVTVVKKTNADWYLIKTEDGEEGYSATQYLKPL